MGEKLSCPFCGSSYSSIRSAPCRRTCDKCGAEGPHKETLVEAHAAWNERLAPALTPKQAAADEMAKALKRCAELVQAACDLITENDLQDREATWDGTTCDGQCYLDDAEVAMDDAKAALAKAGQP